MDVDTLSGIYAEEKWVIPRDDGPDAIASRVCRVRLGPDDEPK